MKKHLQRILDLVKLTGDTMVVVDKDKDEGFVVMSLDRYELMIDLQQDFDSQIRDNNKVLEDFDDELFDECDVFDTVETTDENQVARPSVWDVMKPANKDGETWNMDAMEQAEISELKKQYEQFAQKNTPESVKETIQKEGGSVEVQQSVSEKKDDEFGEEQFYLEPIE